MGEFDRLFKEKWAEEVPVCTHLVNEDAFYQLFLTIIAEAKKEMKYRESMRLHDRIEKWESWFVRWFGED